MLATTGTAAATTHAAVGNIFKLITIALCCCCCCYVNGEQLQQQQQQPQQQQPHKYKQLQYQMQQQQHFDYKQQMQQHQQNYYLQQYQQQQQQLQQQQQQKEQQQQDQQQQQNEMAEQHLPPLQPQMLRTGVSLVVADDGGSGGGASSSDTAKHYGSSGDEPLQPMRRKPGTRKRKRRPQAGLAAHDTEQWRGHVAAAPSPTPTAGVRGEDTTPVLKTRRRKQPAIREPLAALEKEQQLYEMRDKQRKEFSTADKSYRRPYSQAKKEQGPLNSGGDTGAEPTAGTGGRGSVDLKNILKHAGGGMSLSEILQQKNLSLDDLLKGKQNALLALQTTAAVPALGAGEGVRGSGKPLRKTSTANGFVADAPGDSDEVAPHGDTADQPLAKNKLKFPALQRLKLFGSSSRGTTSTTNQGGGGGGDATTAGRRRDPTLTSTSTAGPPQPPATTRIPLYKKRLQQRPTLKPPSLLKVAPSAATTTKEIPTSPETLTTTDQQRPETAEPQAEREPDDLEEAEPTAGGEDASRPSSRAPDHAAETTTSTAAATLPPTTWTAASSERSKESAASASPGGDGDGEDLPLAQENDNNSIERDERGPPRKFTAYTTAEAAPASSVAADIGGSEDATNDDDDDLQNFFEESQPRPPPSTSGHERRPDPIESITSRADHFAPRPASEDIDALPDLDGVDDRTDLLELIEDRGSGNRLFKVLEQRNMTLEELIEHRKRGSSQLHLSTIVQNRSRFFPGQKVVLHDNMDIVTAFENFPHFNLLDLKSVKPDDIKTDSQGSSYFTSIIDIEPTDEVYKSGADETVLRGPAYMPPQRTEKSIGFFPSWKTLALASLATTTRDAATKRNPFYLPQPKMLLDSNDSQELDTNDDNDGNDNAAGGVIGGGGGAGGDNDDDDDDDDDDEDLALERQQAVPHRAALDTVEAIENEVARAHDLLDLELSGHGFKRSPAAAAASMAKQSHGNGYTHMPAGIRSAIVASAAIVITSLATFMVIFVVCRWKQRRRRRTNYMKTYNAMKSKLPTVASASRRSSLRNLETIGDLATISSGSLHQQHSHQQHSQQHQQQQHHHHHQLQRQSSLLFTRRNSDTTAATAVLVGEGGGSSSCMNTSLSGHGGIGSATGSTTSLALSLRSAHNLSATKLNTMDPNSPEVQEYLFDALRNSF